MAREARSGTRKQIFVAPGTRGGQVVSRLMSSAASQAGADANSNVSPGRTGRWAMTHWNAAAYKARLWQSIALPNATDTLRARVKSGGGQNRAEIFARNFGPTERTASIASSRSAWTQITLSALTVTNGHIEVGIYSDANANNWVRVDDFSLTRSGVGALGVRARA